jgi:hypothetical protein
MGMIIGKRLTRENHKHIEFIFGFISNEKFLKYVFNSRSGLNDAIIKEIIVDLGLLVEKGLI